MAEGMISCRNFLQFLAGYVLRDGRFQCGKDDCGCLLNHFERFRQQGCVAVVQVDVVRLMLSTT